MADTPRELYARWRLQDTLLRYPGLRIAPSTNDDLVLAGELHFRAADLNGLTFEDQYEVELRVPSDFPRRTPTARETGGRIAPTFHKLEGDLLCLGARTELRLLLVQSPTLITFVERILIPYLFGHTYFTAHKRMPFGELEHGNEGLLQHFASLFGASDRVSALEFVRVASLRRRFANKRACPCGSGRRLGRCHNRKVNHLRELLGRSWFLKELRSIEREQ
ncbi:MAG: SEC-C domain-containing protein [Planctomycetes bacterium]|nr:SEC-C domain-containing protein [Planctomycetota bacterium]